MGRREIGFHRIIPSDCQNLYNAVIMPQTTFDAVVVGAGGMGSATMFELARRGLSVLALEQFPLVHDQGSSHGQTRIIRRAYYEDPAYVPLVRRAFERWYDLEQRVGRHLLSECGCMNIGPPDGEIVLGVQASARTHSLAVDFLEAPTLRESFPQFRFGDKYVAVLERDAGFLYVEECVRAHLDAARELGATIHSEEAVISWQSSNAGISVTTNKDTYHAAKLVLTAGPWAGKLLAEHGAVLRVMRQVPLWFQTTNDALFRRDVFPAFIADTPLGHFYGLPLIDHKGLKVARHYGQPELTEPDSIQPTPQPEDEAPVREFLNAYLPAVSGPLQYAQTCIYTLTPDRHFLIDLHPEYPNVAVAAGFSGHGFKFAALVGEVLADLVETGRTTWEIDLFRFERFATQ
jgi:sarcosine oxidase